MKSSNWITIIAAIIIGIGIGLTYGWVINPVVYTDVTPDALRAIARGFSILMIAYVRCHSTRVFLPA